MGVDQSLNWIGETSKSQVRRLRHKNLSECNLTIDWKLLKSDCGMPEDAHICGLGPNCIKFGKAVNVGEVFDITCNTTYNIDRRHENVQME